MPRSRKLLLTTLVVGATSAVAGLGVFAAFTATTTNSGNQIVSGSVKIDNNIVSTALYNQPAAGPGVGIQRCLKVTYNGTLGANVRLMASPGITNGEKFNVNIERGSGITGAAAVTNCTGFTTAGTVFNGTLDTLPTSWATAPDARGGTAWVSGDVVDYRFTVTVVDDATPNTHTTTASSGAHTFTWEARNN